MGVFCGYPLGLGPIAIPKWHEYAHVADHVILNLKKKNQFWKLFFKIKNLKNNLKK